MAAILYTHAVDVPLACLTIFACLLGRAINVLLLSALANCWRAETIPRRFQVDLIYMYAYIYMFICINMYI